MTGRWSVGQAELLIAVLARIEGELGNTPTGERRAWRGRAGDEAALLLALLSEDTELADYTGSGDAAGKDDHPSWDVQDNSDESAALLAAHVQDMAQRGVPLGAVRRFLRVAAAAAFAELWHRAGPGDATALLRASRRLTRRQDTAERLLLHAYAAAVAQPAPHSMEVL